MTPKHAAPEETTVVKQRKLSVMLGPNMLPHVGFGIITAIWLAFQLISGPAAVPTPINTAWAAIAGLWYSYLIKPKGEETK